MGSCLGKKDSSPNQQTQFNGVDSNSNGQSDSTELRKVFNKFDIDSDGFIDEDEFRTVMRSMGIKDEKEVRQMFDAADIDGDHHITFEEFKTIANANPTTLAIQKIFDEMDVDGDKELSPKEFQDAFFRLGHKSTEREIEEIFAKFDSNQDGKLNFEEFVRMMNQRQQ